MAGYIEKFAGGKYYEGNKTNGAAAPVVNGTIMVVGATTNYDKFTLPTAADTNSIFLCEGEQMIYDGWDWTAGADIKCYRFRVIADNPYYFVEQNFDIDETQEFDKAMLGVPVGKLMRNHKLINGDVFLTTEVSGTPAAGTAYGVTTAGLIG